jgi:lysophospholipase L1-like esterase
MNRLLVLIALIPACAFSQKASQVTYTPDHAAIEYQGRIDYSDPLKPSFCYSGVSIKTMLMGSSISMTLEDLASGDEQHTNYFNVIIDDSVQKVLRTNRGKQNYLLASGLSPGRHSIEVYKRTECSVGSARFLGFTVAEGASIERPTAKTRRIECIGNSLTCGYGNEVSIAPPPEGSPNTGFHSEHENNYLAYGAITARNLEANYRCVAYSGRGLYRNNTGSMEGTIPKIYARVFPDESSSVLWDVNREQPDVVFINLGSNDFYLEGEGDFVNEELFTKAYRIFLAELRKNYPKAQIVCAVGNAMSDYWPEGRQTWTRIQKLVQGVVNESYAKGDMQIHYFKFEPQSPPYGEDWHPSIATHQKMAKALTPFIKDITGW